MISVREISRAAYFSFLEHSPHTAFHREDFLTALEQARKIEVRAVGFFESSGEMVAVAPLLRMKIGNLLPIWGFPLRRTGIPPATCFCVPSEQAERCVAPLGRWLKSRYHLFSQITIPGEFNETLGDRVEHFDNLQIDLRASCNALWDGVTKNQRREVRKSVSLGVRIHWARLSESNFDDYTGLVKETYSRQGTTPNIDTSHYRELTKMAPKLLTATQSGAINSAAIIFKDEDRIYYWDAATSSNGRSSRSNHLLLWMLIRWSKHYKYKTLDLVGTSIGGRGGSRKGIGWFKQSFGAKPVPYSIVYWHYPGLWLALSAFRLASRIRQKWRLFQ